MLRSQPVSSDPCPFGMSAVAFRSNHSSTNFPGEFRSRLFTPRHRFVEQITEKLIRESFPAIRVDTT